MPSTTLRQPLTALTKLSSQDVFEKYMTEVASKKQPVKLRTTRYFDPVPNKIRARDFIREFGSLGKKGINFLTQSEQDFGQTLGEALGVRSKDFKKAQESQMSLIDMNAKLGKAIIKAKMEGKDTSRLEGVYMKNNDAVIDIGEIAPSSKKSARRIFGEGLGVAATIATFGTYSQAAKGAKTGKLLARSTIKANKAMVGKAGQIIRPELAKRRLGNVAMKVNLELTGTTDISTKAAKAVANINPKKIGDPIRFAKLIKKELAKFGLAKNKTLLRGIKQTASDFKLINQFGKPIYTKGKSSLTASKAFLRSFKEVGQKGAGLGAGIAMSEALKKNQDFIDVLRQTGKGALAGGLIAGTIGGMLDANNVLRYNKAQIINKKVLAKNAIKKINDAQLKLKKYKVLRLAGDKNQETYRTRGGTWFMDKGSDEKMITDYAEYIGGSKRIEGKIKMIKPLVIKNANLADGSFAVVNEGYENFIPKKYSALGESLWVKIFRDKADDVDSVILDHLYNAGITERTARGVLNKVEKNKFDAAMDLIIGKGLKEAGYDGLVLESGKTKHIFNLAKKNFENLLRTR